MTDVSQGPGWWQAADLKWYPPELHADYVAPPVTPTLPPPPTVLPPPPPVTPTQPPVTTKGPSGQRRVGFVLAGLALLAIAVWLVGSLVVGGWLLPVLVAVAIVIIGLTIAVRSGQFGARTAMFVMAGLIAVAAVVVVLAVGADHRFGGGSSPSSGGVAGSSNGGHTSTQAAPPASTTAASGYTWVQLGRDYPGLRTPCDNQPNASGKLQCYWSHYSNAASAESSAAKLPAGALRDNVLADFDFYQKKYPALEGCTTATLTTDFGCIAGAQTLDVYDTEIASIIQQGLSSQ